MAKKTKQGSAKAASDALESPLISNAKLKQLYAVMLKWRLLKEKMGGLNAAIGNEAVLAGTVMLLQPGDTSGGFESEIIRKLIKSSSLDAILRQMKKKSSKRAASLPMQLKKATNAAMVNKKKKNRKIAVAYAVDGTAAMRCWHDAVKIAGTQELPMIFVFENKVHTIGEDRQKIKEKKIGGRKKSCGFPSIMVDGNDVVAVYRVAQEAMQRARWGHGATMIECKIHVGKIRTKWDPILKMQRYLEAKGLIS
jgi:TPP-dependent pyruvate/acetoin dehydrogenase alpha subunit